MHLGSVGIAHRLQADVVVRGGVQPGHVASRRRHDDRQPRHGDGGDRRVQPDRRADKVGDHRPDTRHERHVDDVQGDGPAPGAGLLEHRQGDEHDAEGRKGRAAHEQIGPRRGGDASRRGDRPGRNQSQRGHHRGDREVRAAGQCQRGRVDRASLLAAGPA